MGNKQTRQHAEWAQRKREEIIDRLGRRCSNKECARQTDLQIDHINGRDWEPREMSQRGRVRRYLKEESEGKLQVLCGDCNKRKGCPSN